MVVAAPSAVCEHDEDRGCDPDRRTGEERGQDSGQASRQHAFPGSRWPDIQQVVTTGSGDFQGALVCISHDRTFLRNVTDRLLWIDRGEARKLNRGFSAFEEWRDKTVEEEDLARHKLDRLIKAEARWAVEGISARRKRNQGRVRRLAELRAERRSQIQRTGPAKLELATAPNQFLEDGLKAL